MDELWSFGGVVALWLGVSCGLWWLHRRSVHGGQHRQVQQAARAAILVGEAQGVFDAIRRGDPLADAAQLPGATHALLKRIQEHSGFFDKVNTLRVQMQASFGIADHEPLSEILHIRRDLWAASEILLVEDLGSFGSAFAEPGAYERFRAQAAALLFKQDASEEDVIDLRLSLARTDAATFITELDEAIRAAREKDRLPTAAEVVAYPVAWVQAVPRTVRTVRVFWREVFLYAADVARGLRDSETMARGAGHLRQAREQLPQRLAVGLDRASTAAREKASGLRRHYDFLAAAHDFQAKYEDVLRRAPDVTERGRQFIARLDLAERSERLRLTSANALIWLMRRLVNGLGHAMAAAQRLHAELSATTPWALAAAAVAPAPVRGRDVSAFPSYQRALGYWGWTEERPRVVPGPKPAAKGKKAAAKAGKKPAQAVAAKPAAKAAKGKAAAKPVPGVAAKAVAPVAKTPLAKAPAAPAKVAPKPERAKAVDTPAKPLVQAAKTPAKAEPPKPAQAPAKVAAKPAAMTPITVPPAKQPAPPKELPVAARPEAGPPLRPRATVFGKLFGSKSKAPPAAAPSPSAEPLPAPAVAKPAPPAPVEPPKTPAALPVAEAVPAKPAPPPQARKPEPVARIEAKPPKVEPAAPAAARSVPATPERGPLAKAPVAAAPLASLNVEPAAPAPVAEADIDLPRERPRSFLARMFGRRKEPAAEPPPYISEEIAAFLDSAAAAPPTPAETAPTLLAKLSEFDEVAPEEDVEAEPVADEDAEDEAQDDAGSIDEPGELTLSVMELQSKMTPKPPPIRSFPWLRG